MSASTHVTARLVITGDELLRGFVREANVEHLATALRGDGIDLVGVRIVSDEPGQLSRELRDACERSDVLIVSGGLGPTHDDRTTATVAEVLDRELTTDDAALDLIIARLTRLGRLGDEAERRALAAGNRKQATFPSGATWLDPLGTAPGYVVEHAGGVVIVLPGPPAELRHAWQHARTSAPYERVLGRVVAPRERVVRCFGLAESVAAQRLAELGHVDDDTCRVTLCARDGELEISIRGADAPRVDGLSDAYATALAAHVFARDDERPIAALCGELLLACGWMIGTAESCTGGLVAAALTSVPGSSAWVHGGVVSYANSVKELQLGVDPALIEQHGAVSEAVACAMATGARAALQTDVAVAVTGIAGPDGGSQIKPVGTVHVAVETRSRQLHRALRLTGDRSAIRRRSMVAALHLVRESLVAR